jgi:hypothetical protein
MFETPGYRTLEERDRADRFFKRLLPLALSPSAAERRQETVAQQPGLVILLDHLRAAFERREELEAFRQRLEDRPLLDRALAGASAWLPDRAAERLGTAAISFVIYQPDARGYDRIVMDLLLAFELESIFELLLAHGTHHVLRSRIQGPREWSALPEADLLFALDNLQAEGVADLIDKRAMLQIEDWGEGTSGRAFQAMSDGFRQELERAQVRLQQVDRILADYSIDPTAAKELGKKLRETLVMGGHPVGYHMATAIVSADHRERLIEHVADPFDFVRAYHKAAGADPGSHHRFSAPALEGLARLQALSSPPP